VAPWRSCWVGNGTTEICYHFCQTDDRIWFWPSKTAAVVKRKKRIGLLSILPVCNEHTQYYYYYYYTRIIPGGWKARGTDGRKSRVSMQWEVYNGRGTHKRVPRLTPAHHHPSYYNTRNPNVPSTLILVLNYLNSRDGGYTSCL